MLKTNISLRDRLKESKAYLIKLINSPPLNYYTPRIFAFWSKYGFVVKLCLVITFVFMVVFLGISLGRNLSSSTKPQQYTPPLLPTIAAPTVAPISSQFIDLQKQIQEFSTLLPDPAPPSVDEQIGLSRSFKD